MRPRGPGRRSEVQVQAGPRRRRPARRGHHPDSHPPLTSLRIIRRVIPPRRLLALPALALTAVFSGACTKQVQLKMAVQVVSQPEAADVSFRGKPIGAAPTDVSIKTYEDLQSILAVKGDL